MKSLTLFVMIGALCLTGCQPSSNPSPGSAADSANVETGEANDSGGAGGGGFRGGGGGGFGGDPRAGRNLERPQRPELDE